MNANIVSILESRAAATPEKTAIVHGSDAVTYGDLLRNVRRRAAFFRSRGIGKGDGVLIVVPMSVPLYEILIALFHIGAVAVFVDAWGDRKRLETARRAFPVKAFIGTGASHLVRFVSSSLRSIPVKLKAGLPRSWTGEAGPPVEVAPDDPALITFTTGSTGTPKGANRTHGFLVAQHRALVDHLKPTPDEVDMPTLPIFPLSNLAVGSTTILPDIDFRSPSDFEPADIARSIARNNVDTSSGSPSFFLKLTEHTESDGDELRRLERIFVGGAPVTPGIAERLVRAFPNAAISVVYGSTEAEPISLIDASVLIGRDSIPGYRGLPVGKPVDSIRLRLIRIGTDAFVDETERGIDRAGEICVAGDHVLGSYVGAGNERFFEADGERWLRTGDAGYVDDSGNLFLLGRVSGSWEVDGRRIFVLPAELILESIEGIDLGTIVHLEERTVVAVEASGDIDELVHEVDRRLTDEGIPFDTLVQLKKIPRDPRHASKIDYDKLRKEIEG